MRSEATGSNRNLVPQSELGQKLGQDWADEVEGPGIPWLGAWTPGSLRRGPPSAVDLQVTEGFRWEISMRRSGESYVSVVKGAELRGRTSERPARGRAGATRCASDPPLHTCLRCATDGNDRRLRPFGT